MLGQLQKVSKQLRFLGIVLLDSWGLVLTLMMMFALNRYAVSSIEAEKRELGMKIIHLENENAILYEKIQEYQFQIQSADQLPFQEMMLMQKMLIVPDNCEMFYWPAHN